MQKARLLVNMYLAPVPADSLPAGDQAHERLALAQGIMNHVLDDYFPQDGPPRSVRERGRRGYRHRTVRHGQYGSRTDGVTGIGRPGTVSTGAGQTGLPA